jgi:hypothetical protein
MKTNEHNKPGTSSRLWSIAGAVMQVTLICAFWPLGGRAQSAEAAMKQLRDMDYHVTRANDFTTAFLLAAGKADTNAIELLLAAGLNVDDALLTACNFGELEAARLLINKGANVNAVDSIEGKTMLMYAATRANRLELVKLLVSNLADVNVKDKEGNTVLDYARRDRYTNIVEFLNTRTAGFAEIEGAFGLKLGDTFDVTKGKPTPSGEYEFAAENPVPEFTKYLVSITAKTHRILSITAVGPPFGTLGLDRASVISAALVKKYGGKPNDAYFYTRQANNRSVRFRQWGGDAVIIVYTYDGLIKTAANEQQEVDRAKQESKQRDLDEKAKALNKSGL